jgi:hypothetical protein
MLHIAARAIITWIIRPWSKYDKELSYTKNIRYKTDNLILILMLLY